MFLGQAEPSIPLVPLGKKFKRKPDVIMVRNHLFFCALFEKAFGRNISNLIMGIVTERGRKWEN